MNESADPDLVNFPWERETLWRVLWEVSLGKLGKNPTDDNEDLEGERVRARAAFDETWEAFKPLVEPFNVSINLQNQDPSKTVEEIVRTTCKETIEKTSLEWRMRTRQSINQVAGVIMKYLLEIEDLKKRKG